MWFEKSQTELNLQCHAVYCALVIIRCVVAVQPNLSLSSLRLGVVTLLTMFDVLIKSFVGNMTLSLQTTNGSALSTEQGVAKTKKMAKTQTRTCRGCSSNQSCVSTFSCVICSFGTEQMSVHTMADKS